MWNVATIGAATAATATVVAYKHRKVLSDNKAALEPMERIEMCQTIDQVVSVLQNIGEHIATEELATLLSASLETRGITEGCLTRLSSMHKAHGADLGLCGYAINFVWATILEGVVDGRVIIIS